MVRLTEQEIDDLEEAAIRQDINGICQIYSRFINVLTASKRFFNNHEDLQQECYLALTMALKSWDQKKGSYLAWSMYYLTTRYKRAKRSSVLIRPTKVAQQEEQQKGNELKISTTEFKSKHDRPQTDINKINNSLVTYLDYNLKGIDPTITPQCKALGCPKPGSYQGRCKTHYERHMKKKRMKNDN